MATRKTTKPNIDNLDLAALEALNKATQQRIADVREEERMKLRAEFEQKSSSMGFSLAEVVGAKRLPRSGRKTASKPKYADPNSDKTWSGHGRVPRWMKDFEESGRKREEFLIS